MSYIERLARVKCPYLKRIKSSQRGIVCEGLVKGSEITMQFDGLTPCSAWLTKHCETYDYDKGCWVARALAEKYGEKAEQD